MTANTFLSTARDRYEQWMPLHFCRFYGERWESLVPDAEYESAGLAFEAATAQAAEMMREQEKEIEALKKLLEAAVEYDGGVTYNDENDEVGTRTCCGAISYKPHESDCWVLDAKIAAMETPK